MPENINPEETSELDFLREMSSVITQAKYVIAHPDEFDKESVLTVLTGMTQIADAIFTSVQMTVEVDQIIERHESNPE